MIFTQEKIFFAIDCILHYLFNGTIILEFTKKN